MPNVARLLHHLWPKKIRSQLILGVALVHLVLISVFVADQVVRQSAWLRQQSQEQALGLANDLAVSANSYVLANDFDGLDRLIRQHTNFPHLEYAMILSPDNVVMAHTRSGYLGKKVADSISLGIGKEPHSHILARDNHIVDAAAPVVQDGTIIGWARVGVSQEYIYRNLVTIVRNGIGYILAAIAIGTFVAILIGNRLTRELYKLIDASGKIRSGDRTQRAGQSGSLEITRLATAFNQMLDEIVANEAGLRESEEKFRSLVEQSQMGVYILQDDRYVYVNPVFERISGYTKQELVGKVSFEQLVHEEDLALVKQRYRMRFTGEKPTDHYVLRLLRKDGTVISIEAIVSTIVYKHRPAVIGSIIDITDRLQEENRINKAVIDAQERERMQIGMELHDNVQQIMVGALLTLDYIKRNYDQKPQVMEALDSTRRYLNECIDELRRLSHQLAPSMRVSEDLKEKIYALIEIINVGSSLDVEVDVDEFDSPIKDELQLAFYRILQEQFSNILKYAGASRVAIRISHSNGQIVLSIRDDGKGFDPTAKKRGIGLENIRRRVTAMDGDLRILSSPGQGCELLLQVPLVS